MLCVFPRFVALFLFGPWRRCESGGGSQLKGEVSLAPGTTVEASGPRQLKIKVPTGREYVMETSAGTTDAAAWAGAIQAKIDRTDAV